MRELEIAGITVTADTEQIANGIYQMHVEKDALGPLAFGMLDAQLMELFDKQLKQSTYAKFSPEARDLFKQRIDDWVRECSKEVSTKIYKQAKMVV